MRVLVIEDEPRLVQLVAAALRKNGFAVDICAQLADAAALVETDSFDALIAERMLPDGDALDLVASLRRVARDIPILMLTARDAIEDRVAGLDAGADDYLIKPFAMTELVARVRALMRRPGSVFGQMETIGNLTYDFQKRSAAISGRPLPLSRYELMVLEQLVLAARRVVTKEALIDKVYGLEAPDSNTIPVHVHNLQRRLQKEQAAVRIHTFRGPGYMLDTGEKPA